MIDKDRTFIGIVTRYNNKRQFGFVETLDKESYFFFYDKTVQRNLKRKRIINNIHNFHSGDKVEFKIRPTIKDNNNLEAYDLKFVNNARRQKLITNSIQQVNLNGYLKLIDDKKVFIKDVSTSVYIEIDISEWETDLEEIYYNRLEKLVNYKLINTDKIDNLKAELTDIRFCKEYYDLKSFIDNKSVILATITGKNKYGLYSSILEGQIKGFIPIPKNLTCINLSEFEKITIGQNINVKVKHMFKNKRVTLNLIEKD